MLSVKLVVFDNCEWCTHANSHSNTYTAPNQKLRMQFFCPLTVIITHVHIPQVPQSSPSQSHKKCWYSKSNEIHGKRPRYKNTHATSSVSRPPPSQYVVGKPLNNNPFARLLFHPHRRITADLQPLFTGVHLSVFSVHSAVPPPRCIGSFWHRAFH